MTIKEAIVIAMREMGMTEKEIDHRKKHADLNIGPEAGNAEIKSGSEREVIESLKQLYMVINSDEELRESIHDHSLKAAAQLHQNN